MSSSPKPSSAEVSAAEFSQLKRRSARGGLVTLTSQGANTGIQVLSTIVLARLLTPADFGTVAMVTAIFAFANLFRELGLSTAAIQRATVTHAQHSNLFWLNVATGAVLSLLVAASSPLIAGFYRRPELLPIALALSPTFLLSSLGTQHGARLVRDMQFGRKAVASVVGALTTFLTAALLAQAGFAYWALVMGTLLGTSITTGLLVLLSPFRPSWPSLGSGVIPMLRLGMHITAFDILNYFHRNLDNLLIGKVWGSEALGHYSRAYSLLMLPLSSIRGPINAVALPALSKLQNSPAAFRLYYRRVTGLVALLSMPVSALLIAIADPLILTVLGPNWGETASLFQILAVVGIIQPSATLRGLVVMSLGDGRRYLKLGFIQALATSLGFLAGVTWGAVGVAYSYVISTYLILIPMFQVAFRNSPVRILDYVWAAHAPFLSSLGAATMTHFLLVHHLVHLSPPLQIAAATFTFSCCYLVLILLLPAGRETLQALLRACTSAVAGKSHT